MKSLSSGIGKMFNGLSRLLDAMLMCGRRCIVDSSALLNKKLTGKRGTSSGHLIKHRPSRPVLEVFRRRKRAFGENWRMDETCIKINGEWNYLYRAVDTAGNTINFLIRSNKGEAAARRHLEKVIHGVGASRNREEPKQSRRAARNRYPTRNAHHDPPGKVASRNHESGEPCDRASQDMNEPGYPLLLAPS
jgi:hypothetical protein